MTEPPILLKVEAAAALISCSRTTIYHLLASGELRALHVGRSVRIARTELDRWLQGKAATVEAVTATPIEEVQGVRNPVPSRRRTG